MPASWHTADASDFYQPDVFWLKKDGDSWYFPEVRDFGGSRCAPADTTVL